MNKYPPFDRPTLRLHRKQRFWQIIAPIVLFSLLIMAAGWMTVIAGNSQNRLWADVSIIWLVAPLLSVLLVLAVVLVGLIYLLARVTKGTPNITRRIQHLFYRMEKETRRAANVAVKPVLGIQQFQSGLKKLFDWFNPVK
jgi:uncharacterized membrane protein YciS (DUF1049 family)